MLLASLFMFIGGPDGMFLEKQPVIYGLVCLGISFLLFYLILKIENVIEEHRLNTLSPVLEPQVRQHDDKLNDTKKFLPYWFSTIWLFGTMSTLILTIITVLPQFEEESWAIGHGLFIFFMPGSVLLLFCIIALPILTFFKNFRFSKFHYILLCFTVIIILCALIA